MSGSTIDIKLHPGQAAVFDAKQRFIAMIAGTGSGKTFCGPIWLYREIAKNPHGRFIVVTPTYKIMERTTKPTLLAAFNGTDAEGSYRKKDNVYLLPSHSDDGGIIYFASADNPDHLEGGQFDAAWLDEAGQMSRWTWVVIQARLGLKQGRCLMTTTPYGMNWLYSEVYRRWLSGDPAYFCVQFPSVTNPHYPREEFERMSHVLTEEEFAMRYLGEFSQLSGLAYPEFEKIVTDEPAEKFDGESKRYGGIDFGWTAPSAVLTFATNNRKKFQLTREFYAKQKQLRDMVEDMDWKAEYYADPHAAREIDDLNRLVRPFGCSVRASIADLRPGIMRVNEWVQDGRLSIPRSIAPNLIDEATVYMLQSNPETGKIKETGAHHALDALRYFIMGHENLKKKLAIYFV